MAFELRALLGENLRARGAAEGREPDASLALGLVRSLGRPSKTAARYHRPFTLIHPNDTWGFVAAAAALSILTAPRTGQSFASRRGTRTSRSWRGWACSCCRSPARA